MGYAEEGYEFCEELIGRKTIDSIKQNMVRVMQQFYDVSPDDPDALDKGFAEITKQDRKLRGNVLKIFSRMASLPLLLRDEKLEAKVRELGVEIPVLQAYSIVCMEPGESRFLFLPHQDLKDRTSFESLVIWAPLSPCNGEGGIGVYPGSHKKGPIKHDLSPEGHLRVPDEAVRGFSKHEVVRFKETDCLIFSPYLVHWSVLTTGRKVRWTAIVKVDDGLSTGHLRQAIHPFAVSDFIDERTNEDRLKEADRLRQETGYAAG
ncbi:MAG: phytanoyl-CoA dioxygenase family protein [Acidobacteriota bacterium]